MNPRIQNITVNMNEGYANDPELEVHITSDYWLDDYQFEEVEKGLFFAEHKGFVQFYVHTPAHETGYGGRTFHLKMKNGGIRKIKGPWASRASIFNALPNLPQSTEVTLVTKQGTRFAGTMTIAALGEAMRHFTPHLYLSAETVNRHGFPERRYTVKEVGHDL